MKQYITISARSKKKFAVLQNGIQIGVDYTNRELAVSEGKKLAASLNNSQFIG